VDLWINLLVSNSSAFSDGDGRDPLVVRFQCLRGGTLRWQTAGRCELSDGDDATAGMLRELGDEWRHATHDDRTADALVLEIGKRMSEFLFPRAVVTPGRGGESVDVRERVHRDLDDLGLREQLAIRLRVDERLGHVPAEFALAPGYAGQHQSPISRRPDIVLVRSPDTATPATDGPVPLEESLRILHVTWPGSMEGSHADGPAQRGRREVLDRCAHATVHHVAALSPDAVRAAIADVEPHVLVVGTHGFGPSVEPSGVVACGPEDCPPERWLSGKDLADVVRGLPELRLAVLLSCESGLSSADGPGVGASLADAGVASVLAMSGRPRLNHGVDYLELLPKMCEGATIGNAVMSATDAVRSSVLREDYHHVLISRDPGHRLRATGTKPLRAGTVTREASAHLSPVDRLIGRHGDQQLRVPLLLAEQVSVEATVSSGDQTIDVSGADGALLDVELRRRVSETIVELLRDEGLSDRVSVWVTVKFDDSWLLFGACDAAVTAAAGAVAAALAGETTTAGVPRPWQLAEPDSTGPRWWHLLEDATGKVLRRERWSAPHCGRWLFFATFVRHDDLSRTELLSTEVEALLAHGSDRQGRKSALDALADRFRRGVPDVVSRRHEKLLRGRHPLAVGRRTAALQLPAERMARLRRDLQKAGVPTLVSSCPSRYCPACQSPPVPRPMRE